MSFFSENKGLTVAIVVVILFIIGFIGAMIWIGYEEGYSGPPGGKFWSRATYCNDHWAPSRCVGIPEEEPPVVPRTMGWGAWGEETPTNF
jgi:hypothetical protein